LGETILWNTKFSLKARKCSSGESWLGFALLERLFCRLCRSSNCSLDQLLEDDWVWGLRTYLCMKRGCYSLASRLSSRTFTKIYVQANTPMRLLTTIEGKARVLSASIQLKKMWCCTSIRLAKAKKCAGRAARDI